MTTPGGSEPTRTPTPDAVSPPATSTAPERVVPPRQWPAKWVREESFWREMVTRTLSGTIVLGIGALGAILSGFGSHEQRMTLLIFIAAAAVLITLIFLNAAYLIGNGSDDTYEPSYELAVAAKKIREKRRRRYRPFDRHAPARARRAREARRSPDASEGNNH